MERLDALPQIAQQSASALSPAELVIGTVTAADPLEISVDTAMDTLRAPVLYLTAAVVEKKIPILKHTHRISGLGHSHAAPEGGTSTDLTGTYETSEALEDIACTEFGTPLPVKDGSIILNRGLEAGDKVLLLQVMHGQRFVILSRIFESGEASA